MLYLVGLIFVFSPINIFVLSAIFFLNSIIIYQYISKKRKALIFREQAKESFENQNYKETWDLLSSSLDFASKMSVTFNFTYHNTVLKKHIKYELKNLGIF